MTKDSFLDPQDDRLSVFFEEARTAFVRPPSAAVEQRHLAAMVGAFEAPDVSTAPRRKRLMKRIAAIGAVKALAIGVVALVASGSALAAAGSLPDPAQDAVANTVENVGLNIPGGDDETQVADNEEQEEQDDQEVTPNEDAENEGAGERQGPPARSTTDCPQGFEEGGNHGEFVSGTEETPRDEAARSDCGKPVHTAAPNDGTGAPEEQGNSAEHRRDDQRGPSEQGLEHGQGGPNGESSAEGGS
jgi:hypothetical protein